MNPFIQSGSGGSSATPGAGDVVVTPAGNIAATNVQSALVELDAEKKTFHGVEAAGAVSFDDSTHVLTVASGTNTYWWKGTKYTTASAITCDLDTYVTLAANTLYYVFFDAAAGVLKASASATNLKEHVPVCMVYWNGTAGAVTKETHNHTRDLDWHINAHRTIGTRYYSGLDLTKPTTVNDATLTIAAGIIYDEDIAHSIAEQTTCRVFYLASANSYTFANYSLPYPGTSGVPQYLDTDTYTLSGVGANKFACYWIYATGDASRPIYIIPSALGAPYNTVAAARAETPPALAGFGLTPEMKLIHRLIYNGDGNFQESADYRTSSSLPSGYIASTTAGAVSFTPSGNITSTNVQTAIEELDTEKAPLVSPSFTTPALGTPSSGTLTNCTGLPQAGVTGLTTSDSPAFGTVKLSGLTDGYIPKHTSDAVGLVDSPIYTDGTCISIGNNSILNYGAAGPYPVLQLNGVLDNNGSVLGIADWRSNTSAGVIRLANSRSGTIDSHTAVISGDRIGQYGFTGSDGTCFRDSAYITGEVDGTVSTGVVPGRLLFRTVSSIGDLTERMRINSSGLVGIATTSPASKLSVLGNLSVGSTYANIAAPTSGAIIEGNVGIGNSSPSEILHVTGNIRNSALGGTGNRAVYSTSDGNLTNSSSDKNLKTNISNITYGLSQVLAMRPISYNWIKPELGNQKEIGFIAQEIEEIIPEVVETNSDGMKSLDYPKLVAVMAKAIQELNSKLEAYING